MRAKLQMTQKMKPYKRETGPPEGRTRPIDPARAIQVLAGLISSGSHTHRTDPGMTYLRMAKAIATIVSFDSRGWRWPSLEADAVEVDIAEQQSRR